jgi:methylthioribose-1-phosphate isomerase
MRRVDARFYDKRSGRNLQKLLNSKKINWLIEVCFAVSTRVIVVDGDVMNKIGTR